MFSRTVNNRTESLVNHFANLTGWLSSCKIRSTQIQMRSFLHIVKYFHLIFVLCMWELNNTGLLSIISHYHCKNHGSRTVPESCQCQQHRSDHDIVDGNPSPKAPRYTFRIVDMYVLNNIFYHLSRALNQLKHIPKVVDICVRCLHLVRREIVPASCGHFRQMMPDFWRHRSFRRPNAN